MPVFVFLMLKKEIRSIYKQKRQNLSETEWRLKSRAITEKLWQWEKLEKIKFLHLFLPIQKQKEPNLWDFIHRIWQEKPQVTLLISRTHIHDYTLSHYIFTAHTFLQENAWGVPEPISAQPFENLSEIDMILIPLLAFDEKGYRVGYGKGFYDKFLAQCPQALKVGISLFDVLDEPISDIDDFDVPLDFCITPQAIYDFSSAKS